MTWRANVRVVEVSVVATASNGTSVGDLSAADLRVWDNGKEQTITSFARLDSRAAQGQTALPPNTYSNRFGSVARPQVVTVILLDALNTEYFDQRAGLRAIESILEKIHPEERVAILALSLRLKTVHDFSSDRASLLARLKSYQGELPFWDVDAGGSGIVGIDALSRKILGTLEAMRAISDYLKDVPGRKNLLWLSGAFPLRLGMPAAGAAGPAPFRNLRNFGLELNQTTAALNNANISIYPIDARRLSIDPSASVNISTMRTIASATGGVAYYNRNDLDRGVRLALDDSREVYVLTYTPKSLVDDGAYHDIRVRTSRPGVRLRFRRGYFAPPAGEGERASLASRVDSALSSPLDVSEIGVTASVQPSPGGIDETNLVVRVDAADLSLSNSASRWTGALRLEAIQTGPAGERLGGERQTAQLSLEPASYQRALKDGLRFEMKLKRKPGATAIRLGAVSEPNGRVGSVLIPLSR
jgi:VWFA-related protein